jgi:hypothetical protein
MHDRCISALNTTASAVHIQERVQVSPQVKNPLVRKAPICGSVHF